MEGVNERAGDAQSEEWAGESGEETEVAGKRSSGGTETGQIRAALGEDRGINEAGEDGSPTVGDPERGGMGVAAVYGIREVEYGGPTVGFQGAGGLDRRVE